MNRRPPEGSDEWRKETKRHYSAIVEHYIDAYYHDLSDTPWLEAFREKLPIIRPWVLDAGCGPGQFSVFLTQLGCMTVGVDLSKDMVISASRLSRELSFMAMDFADLGIKDAKFDGILAAYSLLHLPREAVSSVIHEFRRILKSRGILCIMIKEGTGQHVEDSPITLNDRCYVQLYTDNDISSMLLKCGFKVIAKDSALPGVRELQYKKLLVIAQSPP